MMDKLKQILVVAAIIRVILTTFLPQLTNILSSTVEISTPINSFKSLQEAFYYLEYDIDLYDGGINHHPPLLVRILKAINDTFSEKLVRSAFNFVYTYCDLLIAIRLVALNRWYSQHQASRNKRELPGFSDELVAAFYLLNPLTIMTNLSQSTLVFPLAFLSESLFQATTKKNLARSMFCIAVSAYLSFHMAYLVIPIIALANVSFGTPSARESYVTGFSIFSATAAVLLVGSYAMTGSWDFLDSCYGVVFRNSIISPNLGLWWYIFTEMFDFFRNFYVGMFNLFSFVFIVPFTLRLSEFTDRKGAPLGDAFLAVVASYWWLSFTDPYPTVGNLAFGFALIPIFKSSFLHFTRYTAIYVLVLLVCLLLSPIFYYCWIVLGNGNSNFFYSISLIWGTIHAIVLTDLLWAKISADYLVSNDLDTTPHPTTPRPSLTQL